MIRTLRAFFLGRLLREKLLLVAFALIALVLWLSAFNKRSGLFWRDKRETTAALSEQQLWINNKLKIENAAKETANSLKPEQTLDGLRLVAAVGAIAAANNLHNTSSGNTTKESSGEFSIHTLEFNVLNADWDSLRKFYEGIQERAPYIGIKEFTLSATPGRDTQLNLRLKVSSFEAAR